MIVALIILIVPSVCHIVFFATYTIFSSIFLAFTLFLMLFCSFKDPGIVPRVQNIMNDPELAAIPEDQLKQNPSGYLLINRDGHTSNFRLCETCYIFKDKDRRHCSTCDNCVSRFDHHCKYLSYQSLISLIISELLQPNSHTCLPPSFNLMPQTHPPSPKVSLLFLT